MKKNTLTWLFVLFGGYIFLYLPIFYIITFSFNQSPIPDHWEGFSLKWYFSLLQNHTLLQSLFTSLKIAAISATCSVILGTMAALAIVRLPYFKGKRVLSGLIPIPLIMPEVVTGFSLLLLFVTCERLFGIPSERGIFTVISAHITIGIAYVYIIIHSCLKQFDTSLEEAALDLGAEPHTVFFKITFPIIIPSLLSAWFLSFAISLDDVVLASFLSGPGSTTLPMVIFSSLKRGVSPEINALSGIIVLIVFLCITTSTLFFLKANKKIKNFS